MNQKTPLLLAAAVLLSYNNLNAQKYTAENSVASDDSTVRQRSLFGVDTQFNAIVGRTAIPLTKTQPESTLGNFIADAVLAAAVKIDDRIVGAIINYSSIRLDYIPPGAITKGRIYELMPYNNMLTIIDIPGDIVQQFCDHMARKKGWPVSGISYKINNGIATNITVNGEALNPHIVYKIAVSDYLAEGGQNCSFLLPLQKHFTTVLIRDAILDFVAKLEREDKLIYPTMEGRIQTAQ